MPACLYQIDARTKNNRTEIHFKNEVDRDRLHQQE